MSMFTNYDKIPENYIPDNIVMRMPPEIVCFSNKQPQKEYNFKGDFIGYSWEQGDTLTMKISVDKTIKVEEDALILDEQGVAPSSTLGRIGRKAYNTVDIKSWLCTAINGDKYVWKEDKCFTYPKCGEKEITLITNPDVIGKIVRFCIYDFRRNTIYTEDIDGARTFDVNIDAELSDKLIRGIYFFNYTILGDKTADASRELAIIVK